jgi:hypothetical protein
MLLRGGTTKQSRILQDDRAWFAIASLAIAIYCFRQLFTNG